MKSNKTIFFDCYQTLLDVQLDKEQQKMNEQKAWEQFVGLLNQKGIQVDVDNFLALLERRRAEFYSSRDKKIHHHNFFELVSNVITTDLNSKIPAGELATLIYEYRKTARGYARLYPKVAETLAVMAEKYALALASYTQASFTQLELRELGIEQYFSYFIYSSDIGIRKEDPGFYEKCLEIVGQEAVNCVMIGDHYREDILAARKAGLHAIWIRNPDTIPNFADMIVANAGASIKLAEFDTLPHIINQLLM